MSRLGKKIIALPPKTEVNVSGGTLSVKGPLGELSRAFRNDKVSISVAPEGVAIAPLGNSLSALKLWGTFASHLNNMLEGVTKGYKKTLLIEGVGFKADMQGNNLVLNLGFSHPVKVPVVSGLKVTTEKNVISISGIDNEVVGQFSAYVRDLKKPEPYKGKGIRYEKEVILRKEGKKSATV
ncbi:MAG: 50S ribosomal protein L6 [Patescibacteria group bacterium]